jgi:hypothetical protein
MLGLTPRLWFNFVRPMNAPTQSESVNDGLLEVGATELLRLKRELDDIEARYEEQRLKVRRLLESKGLTYIVKDGYEIKKVDDKTIRKFDLELLKEELRFHYMGEGEIQRVIQNSKDFVVQEGIIRIRQLRSDSTN